MLDPGLSVIMWQSTHISNQLPGSDGPVRLGTTMKTTIRRNHLLVCPSLTAVSNQTPNTLLNTGEIHLSVFKQRQRTGGGEERRKKEREVGRMERQPPLITINPSIC